MDNQYFVSKLSVFQEHNHVGISIKLVHAQVVNIMHVFENIQNMDKCTAPPKHYTCRSCAAMETHAIKLLVHSFMSFMLMLMLEGVKNSAEH